METVLSRLSPRGLAPERGKSSPGWPGLPPGMQPQPRGPRESAPTIREHSSTRAWKTGWPELEGSLGARGCPMFPGADEKGPLGLAGICSALSQFLQKKPRFWGAEGPGGGPHSAAGAPGLPGGPGGTLHMATQCFQAAGF